MKGSPKASTGQFFVSLLNSRNRTVMGAPWGYDFDVHCRGDEPVVRWERCWTIWGGFCTPSFVKRSRHLVCRRILLILTSLTKQVLTVTVLICGTIVLRLLIRSHDFEAQNEEKGCIVKEIHVLPCYNCTHLLLVPSLKSEEMEEKMVRKKNHSILWAPPTLKTDKFYFSTLLLHEAVYKR